MKTMHQNCIQVFGRFCDIGYVAIALSLLLALGIAGCAGSASMRIEVEVYKGPLSKEPQIQWSDLVGFLQEVQRGIKETNNFTETVTKTKKFNETFSKKDPDVNGPYKLKKNEEWCKNESPAWHNQIDLFDCSILRSMRSEGEALSDSIKKINKDLSGNKYQNLTKVEFIVILKEITRVAGDLRKKPFRWAVAGTGGTSLNFKVRIAMVNYIVAMAEYGNQLHAKADALLKQVDGHDRQELPLSTQISDTEPTDFIKLFDYWDAATDRSWAQWASLLVNGSVDERVRMVKRLFSDHHWSKINTVYGSGWGKTRMALYKDEIGNWNLKSFDSDPEELLAAYGKVAKTALAEVADIASKVATGGGLEGTQLLLKLADKAAFSTTPETKLQSINPIISDLHRTAVLELETKANKTVNLEQTAKKDFDNKKNKLELAKKSKDKTKIDNATKELEVAKKKFISTRTKFLDEAEEVLAQHSDMVDILLR